MRRHKTTVGVLGACLLSALVGGYLFGFAPANVGMQGVAAVMDVVTPARRFRERRLDRQRLRSQLVRVVEIQAASLDASGDFVDMRDVSDVPDDLAFNVVWQRRTPPPRQARPPRWVADAHSTLLPRGDVCAVILNHEPGYAGGIPLKQAGRVRCSWDLATRINRACLFCGVGEGEPVGPPDGHDPRLGDVDFTWAQPKPGRASHFLIQDPAAVEPRLTVVDRVHRLILPASDWALVTQTYPTIQAWTPGHYARDAAWEGYGFDERQAMFAALEDFNGDGRRDVVFDGHVGSRFVRLLLLSEGNVYRLEELENRPLQAGERSSVEHLHYLASAAPGVYEPSSSMAGYPPAVLDAGGFIVIAAGRAATLWYLEDGTWVDFSLSD